MTSAQFQELCRETSLLLRLPDVEQMGREGQFKLNGHSLGVFFEEESGPLIHCYVDLGELDGEDRVRSLERILCLNLELGRMHGESLGLDDRSGHIVLRSEIQDVQHCTPEQMAEWLGGYCEFAEHFRELLSLAEHSEELAEVRGQLA